MRQKLFILVITFLLILPIVTATPRYIMLTTTIYNNTNITNNYSENPFNQELNTTNNVTFNTINANNFVQGSILYVGNSTGTGSSDDNLIKCGTSSCFLNIKGGTGYSKIYLGNVDLNLISGTGGHTYLRVGATSSTNSGTVAMQLNSSGNYVKSGGLNVESGNVEVSNNISANNVNFNSGNTSFLTISGASYSNISFFNSSGTFMGAIYTRDASSYVRFSGSAGVMVDGALNTGGTFSAASDIYTTGTGDDLWLGTSTQTASRARLYATGVIMLNTSTEVACSATYEGAILYNHTTNKHMGCNGTAWNNLY